MGIWKSRAYWFAPGKFEMSELRYAGQGMEGNGVFSIQYPVFLGGGLGVGWFYGTDRVRADAWLLVTSYWVRVRDTKEAVALPGGP